MTTLTLSARELAVWLGFEGTCPAADADEQAYVVEKILCPQIDALHPTQTIAILSEFIARYLPNLVDAFIGLNYPKDLVPDAPMNNVYTYMLTKSYCYPYFTVLLKSDHPVAGGAKRAAALLAQCMADGEAARLDRQHASGDPASPEAGERIGGLCNFIHLFATFLCFAVGDARFTPVSDGAKQAVVPWLEKWAAYGALVPQAHCCGGRPKCRCMNDPKWFASARGLLLEEAETLAMVPALREEMDWLCSCAMHLGRGKKSPLQMCSKCKTVAYCCKEHQAQHWNLSFAPHNVACHQTVY